MRRSILLLSMCNKTPFIKNMNSPACNKCVHYMPDGTFSKCAIFGEKDILNDKIKYDYIESCRKDEAKCGNEGKQFKEVSQFEYSKRELAYIIKENIPYVVLIGLGVVYIITIFIAIIIPFK